MRAKVQAVIERAAGDTGITVYRACRYAMAELPHAPGCRGFGYIEGRSIFRPR